MGTEDDEDPLNKISQIMDLRPISIKKHEWIFANMVDQKRLAYLKVCLRKRIQHCGFVEILQI